ncbi:FAD-binding oxidoreductase [Myxosarcina sp. GI1]|uniref:NAD(P)/FAD-dependent oxidoreductase n=1 Tax=Myxosarcina sp. GI1 TaxID=1541065 RepID=UPI00055C3499|nr:FAD-dependent oxidoreductase [Myxosarcina sp. GI1]
MKQCEITIIGCGVVGAAIAYELSSIENLQITVIDKNPPATGATKAALGVLMGAISRKTKGRAWRLRETSLNRYQSLIPELEARTGLNIAVNHQGIFKLLFAGDRLDKWQELQALRKSQGWQLELGDRDYVKRQCPHLVNDSIIGAVYSPQDKQINPVRLTQALVAAARQNGVNFCFKVECESFITAKENNLLTCKYLETSAGTIRTDYLIVAAGLGSTTLTASLQQEINIRPVLGQAIKLQLDKYLGREDFQPVITGNDIHIVPLGNSEYWLGATVEFPTEMAEPIADAQMLEELIAGAIAFCPTLTNAKILEAWSGKRPRPEGRSAPVIDKLTGYNNVLLATGHYRNGVLLAPATALEIKQMLNV